MWPRLGSLLVAVAVAAAGGPAAACPPTRPGSTFQCAKRYPLPLPPTPQPSEVYVRATGRFPTGASPARVSQYLRGALWLPWPAAPRDTPPDPTRDSRPLRFATPTEVTERDRAATDGSHLILLRGVGPDDEGVMTVDVDGTPYVLSTCAIDRRRIAPCLKLRPPAAPNVPDAKNRFAQPPPR
jgi:hypothetical protein